MGYIARGKERITRFQSEFLRADFRHKLPRHRVEPFVLAGVEMAGRSARRSADPLGALLVLDVLYLAGLLALAGITALTAAAAAKR